MDFFEILQLLRRRWPVIVAVAVTGLIAGFLTAPGEGTRQERFTATTTVLANPRSATGINLDQAALLATTGDVPAEVASALGLSGPEAAKSGVSAVPTRETSSIAITATRNTREQAELISSTFAETLNAELSGSDAENYQAQLALAQQQVADQQAQADEIRGQIGAGDPANPDQNLVIALDAAQQQLDAAIQQVSQLQAQGAPQPVLLVVEQGEGRPVSAEGVRAPDGRPQRALLLGFFGLVLGGGAAFALDRLDTRIRNKATAEAAFGAPVIAEIPPLPGGKKNSDSLLAVTMPSSPFVESYRALRTVVALTAPAQVDEDGNERGTVIVVTSSGAGEGKTTTSAHLAAMLAEVGRSVLVVSADLRRPRLHVLFDVEREPGLTELLGDTGNAPPLRDLIKPTQVNRVRLLPSGAPTSNPAPLLRQASEVLEAARMVFDYVIVDTAPLLIANDATELATIADGIIIMARAGKTTIDAAQRSAELVERLNTPILGCVLIAATDTPTAYNYYRYRYYREDGPKSGIRRRRTAE